MKGISVDTDARNVGLHEFAHALEFAYKEELAVNEVFASHMNELEYLANQYMQSHAEKPLIRDYGVTNFSEFFSVATEF